MKLTRRGLFKAAATASLSVATPKPRNYINIPYHTDIEWSGTVTADAISGSEFARMLGIAARQYQERMAASVFNNTFADEP